MGLARTITLDFPCNACGYNLRGLPTNGECRQCGRPVSNTLWAAIAGATPEQKGSFLRLRRHWLEKVAHEVGYPLSAVSLIVDAMAHIRRRNPGSADRPNSIAAREICLSLRDYAVARFRGTGAAMEALRQRDIRGSEDVGKIVWALADAGLIVSRLTDSRGDFSGLFTLETLFAAAPQGQADPGVAVALAAEEGSGSDAATKLPLSDDIEEDPAVEEYRVRGEHNEVEEHASANGGTLSYASPKTMSQILSFYKRPVLYQNAYIWLVFLSAMDIMMTWLVLSRPNGYEANALANWVLTNYGLVGMVLYKLILITFVIVVCEMVGRRKQDVGAKFSVVAILIAAFPIIMAFVLLLGH
jgi:uncharacterized repeat protein (TIGR04138 family)